MTSRDEREAVVGEVIEVMTHGILNPLASIGGFSKRLKDSPLVSQDKDLQLYLEVIAKETDRIEKLLSDARGEAWRSAKSAKLTRYVEFKPEHKQVGIAILSYFGQIVSQKYPDSSSRIKIEQRDKAVVLVVETDEGEVERIERSLDLYGDVVCGKAEPYDLLEKERDIQELNLKLKMAAMELRLTKEHHYKLEKSFGRTIKNLENENDDLRSFLGNTLNYISKVRGEIFFQIDQGNNSEEIVKALKVISMALTKEEAPTCSQKIEKAFLTIKYDDPKLFDHLKNLLVGSIAGASGGVLSHWIIAILNSLPK